MSKREYPCEFCDTDQPQERKLVTVPRTRRGKWYIFENVRAWVCPNCGHRYFDAEVVSAMESAMERGVKDIPSSARPLEAYAISLDAPESS